MNIIQMFWFIAYIISCIKISTHQTDEMYYLRNKISSFYKNPSLSTPMLLRVSPHLYVMLKKTILSSSLTLLSSQMTL